MKRVFLFLIVMMLASTSVFADIDSSADIENLDYALYISDTDVTQGSQVTLSICMKNATQIALWQTDIKFPEGITIESDDKGVCDVKLSTTRTNTSRHSITSEMQRDGSCRIMAIPSASNKVYAIGNGEVATITINIDKEMVPGDYTVRLYNNLLVEKNATGHKTNPIEITLTVKESATLLGDVNRDGTVSIADISVLIKYLKGENPENFDSLAADANKSGSIDIDDLSAILDAIIGK